MPSWGEVAKQKNIRYFLISFVDLFGTVRAKIVPASAIDDVAAAGAGFAGFFYAVGEWEEGIAGYYCAF